MVYHAEENMQNDRPTDRRTIGDVCLKCFSTWHFYIRPPYLFITENVRYLLCVSFTTYYLRRYSNLCLFATSPFCP